MYIDKDANGKFSIMEIKPKELTELGAILRHFEYLIQNSDNTMVNDNEKSSMIFFSASIRFKIIDALNLK